MMADFTLVLDREPTEDEQDALYEAGLSEHGVSLVPASPWLMSIVRRSPSLMRS